MQLSRCGLLFSITTLLAISVPVQAFCDTDVQPKLPATPSNMILPKPMSYEQKATSASLQENNHVTLESNQPKTKPVSIRDLDNEIQRTKPMPQKYQPHAENAQLLIYQQQVRSAQINRERSKTGS